MSLHLCQGWALQWKQFHSGNWKVTDAGYWIMFLNPPGSLWSASQSLTTRVCGPWYGSPEDIESHFMPPDGQSSWHEYRRSYDLYLASTCSNLFTVKIDLHDTCLSHLASWSSSHVFSIEPIYFIHVLHIFLPMSLYEMKPWDLCSKCMRNIFLPMNWSMKKEANEEEEEEND